MWRGWDNAGFFPAELERLLKEAEDALRVARSIVEGASLDDFMRDQKSRFALRYSLVLKDFNVTPRSYREAFMILAEKGVVSVHTAQAMEKLAALRNMLVHRYWRVSDERIYEEAHSGGLDIVERFVEEVRRYAESTGERGGDVEA